MFFCICLCWMIFLLSVLCIIISSSRPCGKYLALFLSKCHWLLTLSKWCCAFTRPLCCFCTVFILTWLGCHHSHSVQYSLKRWVYLAFSCSCWRLTACADVSFCVCVILAKGILMYNINVIATKLIYCPCFISFSVAADKMCLILQINVHLPSSCCVQSTSV